MALPFQKAIANRLDKFSNKLNHDQNVMIKVLDNHLLERQ
jgi:hypothetical protein